MKIDIPYKNSTISFIHLKKRHIRNIYISIDKQRGVLLKSNLSLKKDEAKEIILKKAEWIIQKLNDIKNTISTQIPNILESETIYFKNKKIFIKKNMDLTASKVAIWLEDDYLNIKYNPNKHKNIQKNIDLFYKEHTEKVILNLVEKHSQKMQLMPNKISFKKYKRKWGCCDAKNNITFNSTLSQFCDEITEYIVIHELAHIREKNHSKNFWAIVKEYKPNYKEIHKKMRFAQE